MATKFQGSKEERLALDTYIKLSRAANATELRINRHLSDYGLTLSQFGVLEALYHLGPLHQHQLGEKILKSSGNMTLVIDNLCKQGLVKRERSENDRRYIAIHLTEEGSRLTGELFPKHVEKVVLAFRSLSSSEQEQLAVLCKKLGVGQLEQV
ncbi:MAG: MarR family transcriptional regulator [Trueperaceae bacterium]|nr:MarR family transcriptional regulator [Trueperaceae bacterium]